MNSIKESRKSLRSDMWSEFRKWETDQKKRIPHPPPQKPYPENSKLVELISPDNFKVGTMPLRDVINKRRSRRKYNNLPISLEELSFLLWSTQGVQEIIQEGVTVLKTVPSGGARHPFETYLVINRVTDLEPGLYRYLSIDHKLLFLGSKPDLDELITEACNNQRFIKDAAVVFVWTTIPYRMEWRYHLIAHKVIAIDAGHLCQNLYLSSESIGAGTCGIGAYDQDKVDSILGVDGVDEFTIYIAPVGKTI
jgi:SagB-type dehydrogenase family enzyme